MFINIYGGILSQLSVAYNISVVVLDHGVAWLHPKKQEGSVQYTNLQ